MTFTFIRPASSIADAFLERCAAHLATLSPEDRAKWFREWIPAAQRLPIGGGVSAFDKSHVITTLMRWQDEAQEAA